MMKQLTSWVMVAAALLVTATPVGATQPNPATTIADDALSGQASDLHQQGIAYHKARKFNKAHAALTAAWGIKKHYRIAGVLGAVEHKLGKYRDAAEHLHFFFLHFPENGDAKDRARTTKIFDSVVAKVVQLTVVVDPTEARAEVNGVSIVAGELGFYEPGTYEITAKYGKVHTQEKRSLEAGTKHTVLLTLEAPDGARTPPVGVDARLIAGTVIGVGALAGFAVGIGGTVAAGGYADDVAALQTGALNACTDPLLGAHCQMLAEAGNSQNAAQDVAAVGYVSGALLAATSVGLLSWWAFDSSDAATKQPTVTGIVPIVDDEGARLMLMGAW